MKAKQTAAEIRITRIALRFAMQDVGQVEGYDWLSSRSGGPPPGDLTQVLGGSGYFNSKEKRTDAN